MTIPDFQTVMLPLLQQTAVAGERRLSDLIGQLSGEFALTEDESDQLLPSGRQSVFANRVHWAATHLRKAGVLESAGKGVVRITPRGRDLLREGLPRIDMRVLQRYPEWQQFRSRQGGNGHDPAVLSPTIQVEPETPEESLIRNYQQLNEALRDELLVRIKSMPPAFFERLVVDLMLKLGYGGSLDSGQSLGRSGDGGVDGIIKEDKLGLDVVYLQAKLWQGTVGRPEIQGFAGSLEGHRARKGVFITTSGFSQEAREYVGRIEKRIVLIDGPTLANLMIESGLGVATVATYELKRVDSDYFTDE